MVFMNGMLCMMQGPGLMMPEPILSTVVFFLDAPPYSPARLPLFLYMHVFTKVLDLLLSSEDYVVLITRACPWR